MKKSQNKPQEDWIKPMGWKSRIIVIGLVSAPLWVTAILMNLRVDVPKTHYNWDYDTEIRKPDIVNKPPIFESERDQLLPENRYGSGVTLYLNGVTIETGLTSDEIIQQLTLDYQDLFDQYGGSEELY